MKKRKIFTASIVSLLVALAMTAGSASAAQKPNIVFIMGDDIGWFNIGAYHRGIMAGKTLKARRITLLN